jgi:AraC-like DNA-binding protein
MKDSVKLLEIVHAGMVNAGLNVTAIYDRLGYDIQKLAAHDLRTPHAQRNVFWGAVEDITGDPEIGLHLCPHFPVFRGEVIDYLFFSAANFREGCKRALKYLRLVSDALDIRLVEEGAEARAIIVDPADASPLARHSEICITYSVMRFSSCILGELGKPKRVVLRCERRLPQAEYERVFGCPVKFGGENIEIIFDRAALDHRSPHSNPELLQLHEELAEKRLSSIERQDLIERIRALFSQSLELDSCGLDEVAERLGLPARRLRFELTCAGTSFSKLLSDFRYGLARRLLGHTDERIENIVYLTGFSEPSAFYRAFKRWSGMTPVQYRERKQGRASSHAETADS